MGINKSVFRITFSVILELSYQPDQVS